MGAEQCEPLLRVVDHLIDAAGAEIVHSAVEAMIAQVRCALGVEPQLGFDEHRDLRLERAIVQRLGLRKCGRGDCDDEGNPDERADFHRGGYFSVLANNPVSLSNARSACGWL